MASDTDAKRVTHYMPTDGETLAAMGRVAIRHGFLDLVLRRTVKTLARITVDQADLALATENSSTLRDMIKVFANQALGRNTDANLKVRALLTRCKMVAERRNSLFHTQWVEDEESAFLMGAESAMRVPSAADINGLADEIYNVAQELNGARFGAGFIAVAMAARKVTTPD